MKFHSTVLVRAILLTVLLAGAGCGPDEGESPTVEPQPALTGVPAIFPAGGLRLEGPPDLVLAEGDHGIHLTLAEYNARVEEVPLPADSDTTEARWSTLKRLVDLKVVAAEGRLRGYVASDATDSRDEEHQLVRQIAEAGMLGAQLTPDAEARAYFEEHPDVFPDGTPEMLETPAYLNHIKFTMYNERWMEDVERWSEREQVIIHRDRFAALQPESSTSPPDTLERGE